jgi:SAM-dependent methyltransferase
MIDDVLQGYASASAELIARFEEVSPAELYAPVADLLPTRPSRIADIGAGTGRDAAWLAGKGHRVVAVEPVDEFRRAGMALHKSTGSIAWLNDRLPDLYGLRTRKECFDWVVLSAVWQHLDNEQRSTALRSLAALTAPGGTVIISLRHGAGASSRCVHEARPQDTIAAALRTGLELMRERRAASMQAVNRKAGVYWTWLVFRLL